MPAVPADIYHIVEPGETFTYFIEGIESDQWESEVDELESPHLWQLAMGGFYVATDEQGLCGETHPGCMCEDLTCRTAPSSPLCGDESSSGSCETGDHWDGAFINSLGQHIVPNWYDGGVEVQVCGPALFLNLSHFEWRDGSVGRWSTDAPVEEPDDLHE
jgi:hypothetical protein